MPRIVKKRELGPIARKVVTISHHTSYILAKRFPKSIPIIFVTGYPKSGTVWACQMVADYLQMPFADLSYFPVGFPSVMHGHYLIKKNGPPAVYVMRDGRDTMVSMYFHISRELPKGANPQDTPRYRRLFPGITDLSDVKSNLPRFIEGQIKRPNGTSHNWGKHVASWYDTKRCNNVPTLKFEDLKKNPEKALSEAIQTLTGESADPEQIAATVLKYSFAKQSGREAGKENRDSFLRKGVAGDWLNYFSKESADLFNDHFGDALVQAGYEPNLSWTDHLPQTS